MQGTLRPPAWCISKPIDISRAGAGKRGTYEELLKNNIWLHNLSEGTSFEQAVKILKFWDAWERTPASIRKHLETARPEDETVKFDDYIKMNFRVFGVMPKDKTVFPAAKEKARALGYTPYVFAEFFRLEAREAGAGRGQHGTGLYRTSAEPVKPPCALISGGELLVNGGR